MHLFIFLRRPDQISGFSGFGDSSSEGRGAATTTGARELGIGEDGLQTDHIQSGGFFSSIPSGTHSRRPSDILRSYNSNRNQPSSHSQASPIDPIAPTNTIVSADLRQSTPKKSTKQSWFDTARLGRKVGRECQSSNSVEQTSHPDHTNNRRFRLISSASVGPLPPTDEKPGSFSFHPDPGLKKIDTIDEVDRPPWELLDLTVPDLPMSNVSLFGGGLRPSLKTDTWRGSLTAGSNSPDVIPLRAYSKGSSVSTPLSLPSLDTSASLLSNSFSIVPSPSTNSPFVMSSFPSRTSNDPSPLSSPTSELPSSISPFFPELGPQISVIPTTSHSLASPPIATESNTTSQSLSHPQAPSSAASSVESLDSIPDSLSAPPLAVARRGSRAPSNAGPNVVGPDASDREQIMSFAQILEETQCSPPRENGGSGSTKPGKGGLNQESMSSYMNRKASVLMILFPMAVSMFTSARHPFLCFCPAAILTIYPNYLSSSLIVAFVAILSMLRCFRFRLLGL